MSFRIAIVGAGVTGLVAGRELARRGYDVELFERWPDVAGQASAFDLGDGTYIERYYHHLFQSDREMIELHEELLPGALQWHRSSVGIYAHGRIWPFVSPRDLLGYSPLPFADRLRLGAGVLRLMRRSDWESMDDISAMEWLARVCGERAMRGVWLPLLLGKFGDDAPQVPLAWLWSKFVLRRGRKGKGAARELLGYPRGSFRAICVALAEEIKRQRGTIHLDREVVRIERDGDAYLLHCARPGAYRGPVGSMPPDPSASFVADAVLLTTPVAVTAAVAEWPADYRRRLEQWTYRAAVVLLLELQRAFSKTYWVNVGESDIPFLGLVEHTNLVPPDWYGARYLYVSNYVAPSDPLARMSTEELLRHYLAPLRHIAPGFGEHDILRYWSFREEAAQPVPRVGNRHRILPLETSRPGVFVANTTQIYPEDRGTNYSVRLGRTAAEAIDRWARPRPVPVVRAREPAAVVGAADSTRAVSAAHSPTAVEAGARGSADRTEEEAEELAPASLRGDDRP
jgi:protoporphyrinogen oxidase